MDNNNEIFWDDIQLSDDNGSIIGDLIDAAMLRAEEEELRPRLNQYQLDKENNNG